MSKSEFIRARVEPKLKASSGRVLRRVGISTTDAITIFLRQVVLHGGLPFDARVPNAETRKSIAELDAGKGERFEGGTARLLSGLGKNRRRRA